VRHAVRPLQHDTRHDAVQRLRTVPRFLDAKSTPIVSDISSASTKPRDGLDLSSLAPSDAVTGLSTSDTPLAGRRT